MNERRNNISSEAPSTFNWIFEESVEDPVEQDLEWPSFQDSETNRHPETEWETDTTSDEESGQEESLEADEGDEAGGGWGTESDERSETSENFTPSHTQRRHWDSFVDWLKSDLPVYWITGKPGSGKSTLMKFLISDSRTPAALKEWKKDAIIIAHFFWKPGSTMQHSFKGFLCSLMRLILKSGKRISNSSLQRMITDKDGKYSPSDWDPRELRDLLLHYRKHSSQPLCIFIDALDEISPEQDTLDTLQMLGALISPTIKLCVSSRPERLFRLHLHDKPSLEIHELTGPDIERYSKVSIRDSILLEPQGLGVSDLSWRIREKSQGVFLWAVLVTRSLIRGINNGDSKRDIYRRLDSTPQDLMDLYRDILLRSAADRDIYQQSASMIFSLVLALKGIPMPLFEATVATDEPLLDQLVVEGKEISAQDLVAKSLRMGSTLEVGGAGLLEVHSFKRGSNPMHILTWLETTITFIHRSAEEFLLDTEDGRKLWESCPCSQEQLLIRRAKAKLAWYELYPSLDTVSEMESCQLPSVLETLTEWIHEVSLPSAVSTTMLTLALRMYLRGSLLAAEDNRELVPLNSRLGQFLIYAAVWGHTTFVFNNLATVSDSERHETAYYIFYNACSQLHPPWDDGNMMEYPTVVRFMIENGYSTNWPGSSETTTCKFDSPWLRYLLALHKKLLNLTYMAMSVLTSTQARKALDTVCMFLKSGASLHSRFKVVFSWPEPDICNLADIRLGALWLHRFKGNFRPDNSDFLILEINAKVLLESILIPVNGLIRPASRLKLPEAAPYMKALAFGNYEEQKYFIVHKNWVSDFLLEGVKVWLQHVTRKGDDIKLKEEVTSICSYATDKVSEASCRQAPWPF